MWPLPSLLSKCRSRGQKSCLSPPSSKSSSWRREKSNEKIRIHTQASPAYVKTLTLGCYENIIANIELFLVLYNFSFLLKIYVGTSALIFGIKVLKAEGDLNTSIFNRSIKKTVLLLSKYNYSHSSYMSNLTWKCLRQCRLPLHSKESDKIMFLFPN